MKRILNYFTKTEKILWLISVSAIILTYIVFDGNNLLTFIASVIGVASLIFNAKGNPIGQALMVIFSLLYGVISYGFNYYGEIPILE